MHPGTLWSSFFIHFFIHVFHIEPFNTHSFLIHICVHLYYIRVTCAFCHHFLCVSFYAPFFWHPAYIFHIYNLILLCIKASFTFSTPDLYGLGLIMPKVTPRYFGRY